jgi:toxin ParE1/3/4
LIVVFSRRADAELEQIGDWIARDNPLRAITFVEELREACVELGDNPQLYPLMSDSGTLRKRPFQPYLILYRVRRKDVLIVSIWHSARDNRQPR